MKPTKEQKLILKSGEGNKNIKINAYSGAGKSSTLRLLAESLNVPSLYLTFNKANADEAKDKFPPHVKCSTIHSMAYAAVGFDYVYKLNRPKGAYVNVVLTPSEIAKWFKLDSITLSLGETSNTISASFQGLFIRNTVAKFEQSKDSGLDYSHQPTWMLKPYLEMLEMCGWNVGKLRKMWLEKAKSLWLERSNPQSRVGCTHDTYLKVWQLSKPDLSLYSVIYTDESQDVSGVMLDILENNTKESKIVMVGDSFQAIYGWRGAQDAMNETLGVEWEHTQLSTSFRFGDKIAKIANMILNHACLDDKHNIALKGARKGLDDVKVDWQYDELPEQVTRLYRTNSALLMDAVVLLEQGVSCRIDVDVRDTVGMIESVAALMLEDKANMKHIEVLPYDSFRCLMQEGDVTLVRIGKLVESGAYKRVLAVLKSHRNPPNPDVILTTAHKSKGMEWDDVMIADDFPSIYNKKGELVGLGEEERNLLYVAATRAKKTLFVNSTIRDLIEITGEMKCTI